MCSRPSDLGFSLHVPFERVFWLTIKNDGQFTADCDSGEEYNGSVD